MRTILLATTLLTVAPAFAQTQTITPASGTLTDAAGNVFDISASGSVQENGAWTPGGGDTSAVTIQNGVVLGQDSRTGQWFSLSASGQFWTPTPAPAGVESANAPPAASPVAPAAATSALASCSSVTSSAFGILPLTADGVGQIFGPDQKPFTPRGINIMEPDFPTAALLAPALFPGMNFIRFAIYNLSDDPATYASLVQSLTAAGIVVEFEDHTTSNGSNAGGSSGVIFTGALLSNEQAFYTRFASYYKSNPFVWWGTNNEPPNGPGLSGWQLTTYQTIRATGNSAPILLEINGYADPSSFGQGLDPSAYAQMSNVIWDMHFYGWLTGYSTDQGTNDAFLAAAVHQAQTITGAGGAVIPVMIGEYGNSTVGTNLDPNANQVIAAVQNAGKSGLVAGTAAWAWGQGNPYDGLTNGGGLSSYGQQVETYLAGFSPSATAAGGCASQQAAPASTVVAAVAGQPNEPAAAPSQPSAADTTAYQAASAQADQAGADADAQVAAAVARVQQLQATPPQPTLHAVGDVNN